MSSSSSIVLRVRTQVGTWRLQNVRGSDSLGHLRNRLEVENKTDLEGRPFTVDPAGTRPLNDTLTVQQARLANGDMIYAMVDETKTVFRDTTISKVIMKDGSIVEQETTNDGKGFRHGMPALRDMKMHWTLNEFVEMDEQFVYKFKKTEKAYCTMATLEKSAIEDFQNYMMSYDYRKMRVGYLYGSFSDDKDDHSVRVECIYEPPQDTTDVSFALLEDPMADRVQALAEMLDLKKVGWIVAHPPREEKFFMSGAEVIAAAEQQLEAAGGIVDTPFITITVTIAADDPSKREVLAYQVTKQGMEMAAEGALLVSPHLGCCAIDPTFTAIVEQRATKEVDTAFFISPVPITSFDSKTLLTTFPKANREGVAQTRDDLKRQISKAGREGWTLQALLADFHLLLFLCDYFDIHADMPQICHSVRQNDVPIDEGYQLLIRSIAGLDG